MNILFLSRINFWKATNTGGKMISKRNYELLKAVYARPQDVIYYCTIDDETDNYQDDFKLCINMSKNNFCQYFNYLFLRSGYGRNVEKQVVTFVKHIHPDIIFFDGSWHGNLLKKISKANNSVKVIAFYHNIETYIAYKNIHENNLFKPYRYFYYWCIKANERYLSQKAHANICLNERDSCLLNKLYSRSADFILPTTIKDSFECKAQPKKMSGKTLLFVGTYFTPNIQGITWFINNIIPYINAKLYIVGRNMQRLNACFHNENVIINGEVADLSIYYQEADAVISPIFSGGGMKTKTAEAMMHGKAIFATDEALEGYDIENVSNIYRCNTVDEFIQSINSFFNNKDRYDWYPSIRELFLKKYEFSAIKNIFIEWLKGKELFKEER